jgi:hypothetical protein
MADNPQYSLAGKTISTTANWMRLCNIKVYVHTKEIATDSASDASTYNQKFSKPNEGDVILDVSKLRCTFDIKRYAMYYPNTALIKIYNLTAETENAVIMEGYRITVDAGYPSLHGQIFDGTVIMCNRWKENGTDYVLQILAMDGNDFLTDTYCNFTYQKGQTMRSTLETIAKNGGIDLDPNVSADLDAKFAKGGVVNGPPKNMLSDLAKSMNGTWYVDSGVLHFFKYSQDPSTLPNGLEAVELSEKTGLIGTPQQHQQGVNARSFLNPKIVPYSLVHIPNDKIIQDLVTVGSYNEGISSPALIMLDSAGLYRVIVVNFIGDTRGGEGSPWYSDINTVRQLGTVPEMLSNIQSTIN